MIIKCGGERERCDDDERDGLMFVYVCTCLYMFVHVCIHRCIQDTLHQRGIEPRSHPWKGSILAIRRQVHTTTLSRG